MKARISSPWLAGTVLLLLSGSPLLAQFDCTAQSEITLAECEALVALYQATDGPNWTSSTDWLNPAAAPCTWFRVTCRTTTTPHVVQLIRLSGNNLVGQIPPELENLDSLVALDLSDNFLSGPIPPGLGNLPVTEIRLRGNQLTGPIPTELRNLTEINQLVLADNRLTGPIPPELGELAATLQTLIVDSNALTGPIPPELGDLFRLRRLHLFGNELTGGIPATLGDLSDLNFLLLQGNHLSGEVPLEITFLNPSLSLDISDNCLTASDPDVQAYLDDRDPGWEADQCQRIFNDDFELGITARWPTVAGN